MKKSLIVAGLGLVALAGVAIAQTYPAPTVTSVGPTDLFQDVVAGAPQVGNQYATARQISGIVGVTYVVPLTGFTLTVPNATKLEYINPAGTLATGAFTLMASPGDGQETCLESSQTQTAVTVAANTGQSLASYGGAALTAMTANTKYCYVYIASQAAWVRTQ